MSRHEDREADGLYIVRVIETETGRHVETTWTKTRAQADIKATALRERYDTPETYRFEVDVT